MPKTKERLKDIIFIKTLDEKVLKESTIETKTMTDIGLKIHDQEDQAYY